MPGKVACPAPRRGLPRNPRSARRSPDGALQLAPARPPDGLPDAGQQCATLQLPVRLHRPQRTEDHRRRLPRARRQSGRPPRRPSPQSRRPGRRGARSPPRARRPPPPERARPLRPDRFRSRVSSARQHADLLRPVRQAGDGGVRTAAQKGGFAATAALMRGVADACESAAGDVLPFVTTANTARDMDQIRQALGEAKDFLSRLFLRHLSCRLRRAVSRPDRPHHPG